MNHKIRIELSKALQVITRDVKIRAWLEAHDPNALAQAEKALREEYKMFSRTVAIAANWSEDGFYEVH